jgi:hypothetical protein
MPTSSLDNQSISHEWKNHVACECREREANPGPVSAWIFGLTIPGAFFWGFASCDDSYRFTGVADVAISSSGGAQLNYLTANSFHPADPTQYIAVFRIELSPTYLQTVNSKAHQTNNRVEATMASHASTPSQEGPSEAPPRLPEGWIAQWDGHSRKYYYVQLATGVSTWELPTEPAPGVPTGQTPTGVDHPYGTPQEGHTGERGVEGADGERGLGVCFLQSLSIV